MNRTKNNYSYIVFVFVFYLFVFKDFFENYISFLGLADEVFAALAFPIAFLRLIHNKWRVKKSGHYISGFLCAYVGVCFLGSVAYQYQPFSSAVLPDLFLNIKFWLSIYVGSNLFVALDIEEYGRKIGNHVKMVTILFILLIIYDYIFNIFPGDVRYGFKSTQLFYGIHTSFAAICAFLIVLLTLVRSKVKNYHVFLVLLLILMGSTMRSKAFCAILLFLLLYFLIYRVKTKLKMWHLVCLAVAGLFIGWSQIQYYFFSEISGGAARNVLLINCFKVASDHFPLGSGFATYASHFSGVVYSPIYLKYGLSSIYGLTANHPVFISDSFWPMIIAQGGYFGLVFYLLLLWKLFCKIQKNSKVDKDCYMASLFAMTYLCISSLAESAFVHPVAIPLAIVIGMSFAEKSKRIGQGELK